MMEVEQTLIRNFILIGSTGSGKSTTCNRLFGEFLDKPFTVSDEEISCTFASNCQISKVKSVRIIDTPGFGDTRYDEKHVDKVIRELTFLLSDPRVDSTGQIDAFILPVKFNPRPSTLKTDLEHLMDLFGTAALKTLIILPIFEKPGKTLSQVLEAFGKMDEIVRIIKEGKKEEPNVNWFCIWDNLKPLPNQEQELFSKISKLEPYTHKKFIEADQEIKKRLDAKVKSEVERLIARVKKDYEDDKKAQEQHIQEIKLHFEEERRELIEARDRATQETAKFMEAIKHMSEEHKQEMAQMYEKMREEKDRNHQAAMKMIQEQQANSSRQMEEIMKKNNEITANMQMEIAKLAARPPTIVKEYVPAPSRGGCNMF